MKVSRKAIEIEMARKQFVVFQLAEAAGISYKGLRLVLTRGDCIPRTAGKIANALGVPVEKIMAKEA